MNPKIGEIYVDKWRVVWEVRADVKGYYLWNVKCGVGLWDWGRGLFLLP